MDSLVKNVIHLHLLQDDPQPLYANLPYGSLRHMCLKNCMILSGAKLVLVISPP